MKVWIPVPLLFRRLCRCIPDDTAETLAARILKEEHKIYPQAIRYFAEGRIIKNGRHVEIKNIRNPDHAAIHNPPLDR